MTEGAPALPWTLSDMRTMFLTTAAGIAAVLAGWWEASGVGRVDRQIGWIVLGIVGLIVTGIGNFFWLLAGRRTVALRRAQVLATMESDDGPLAAASERVAAAAEPSTLVAVKGSRRYHRPACLVVNGKAVHRVSDAEVARLQPCEMCGP